MKLINGRTLLHPATCYQAELRKLEAWRRCPVDGRLDCPENDHLFAPRTP